MKAHVMSACVTTAGGAGQITACAVRMALASNAEIFAGKKSRSMSAADTAREGRVYDWHGFHHHPRGSGGNIGGDEE